MKPGKLHFILILSFLTFGSVNAQNFNEKVKAVASDRGADDLFGNVVSISGNYAIVGARVEDHDTAGANTLSAAGSAYIFERNTLGKWSEVQKIVASDRGAWDLFASSVSISGNYAIVGSPREEHDTAGANTLKFAGSAYIFERNTQGYWKEVKKIIASDRDSNDQFGASVSISGNYAIVGAYTEEHDTAGLNKLILAGSAYIFERNTSGKWSEVQKIVASDRGARDQFGGFVCVSGNYAIVSANLEDQDSAGSNTLTNSGSAYIFERNSSGKWEEANKIVASDRGVNDKFGNSVSISGKYAIVGATFEDHNATGTGYLATSGSAYIFGRNGSGNWGQVQKIVASDRSAFDQFGGSVSISGKLIIVGALREEHDTSGSNTLSQAGSAYIFERNGTGNWKEIQKIVASDRGAGDLYGIGTSISGSYAIVGASYEDQDTSGSNTLSNAGSAYIYGGDPVTVSASISAQTNVLCKGGANGSLTAKATSGKANYSYVWSNKAFTSNTSSTTNTISGLAAGNYSVTITDSLGDSSIATATIIEPSLIITSLSITACQSYYWALDSTTYTTSGVYTDTLTSAANCDSIITLNLTINKSNKGTHTITACGSYMFNGITYTSSNSTALDTLTNAANCDSIVTLNLTINNSTNSTVSATACNAHTWALNGVTYTSSGTYYDTLTNVVNCDSIIALNLTINKNNTGTHTIKACGSYMFNGITYTSSNSTALDTFTNATGCDSIVRLSLTINNNTTGIHKVAACESYDFNGITYVTSNSAALDTLVNSSGCDSIVTLDLTINNSSTGIHTVVACDSYTFNGMDYTSNNNTAKDTLTNALGCDSIVTLNLTINTVDVGIRNTGPSITANATGASYQWLDCNSNFSIIPGDTFQLFTANSNGSYAVQVTENACIDTSKCTVISSIAIAINPLFNEVSVYPNPVFPGQNLVNIDLRNLNSLDLKVYNSSGVLIYQEENIQSPKHQFKLNVSSGIYILELNIQNQSQRFKLIKN